jgi:Uma2 family endonuclease
MQEVNLGDEAMNAPPAERLMTAEELLQMPDDGKSYELVAGRLLQVAPSAWLSGVVAANLLGEMSLHVRRNHLGICGTASRVFSCAADQTRCGCRMSGLSERSAFRMKF